MAGNNQPASTGADAYDVIVVGGGVGGLTAGALLAKAGARVLVVEGHEAAGGYARSLRRGPYSFDPAVHGLAAPAVFQGLLDHLGVADRCSLLPVETYYQAALPGLRVDVPIGSLDALVEAHASSIPGAAGEMRNFLELCSEVHRQAHELPQELPLSELDRLARELPLAFRYRKATVADVLEEQIADPRARALCGISGLFLGLPPSKLSFQTFAQSLHAWVVEGGFYFEGGAQSFTDALVDAIQAAGGELMMGSAVTEISISEGRASGVVLDGGVRLRAGMVVSNADAERTFDTMLGTGHLPGRFLRKLSRLEASPSAVALCAATEFDLAAAGALDTVLVSGWDLDASYADTQAGNPGAVVMRFPSLVDPTLAPHGRHVAVVIGFAGYEQERPWEHEAERWQDALLAVADATFPGFRDGVTHAELLTPESYRRMSLTSHGSTFGWAPTPAGAGGGRPAPRSPLPGLYLAGAWTQPGGCFSALDALGRLHEPAGDAGLRDRGSEGRLRAGRPSRPRVGTARRAELAQDSSAATMKQTNATMPRGPRIHISRSHSARLRGYSATGSAVSTQRVIVLSIGRLKPTRMMNVAIHSTRATT